VQHQVVTLQTVDANLRKRRDNVADGRRACRIERQARDSALYSEMATRRGIQFVALQLDASLTESSAVDKHPLML
jgi:hypothetical protein